MSNSTRNRRTAWRLLMGYAAASAIISLPLASASVPGGLLVLVTPTVSATGPASPDPSASPSPTEPAPSAVTPSTPSAAPSAVTSPAAPVPALRLTGTDLGSAHVVLATVPTTADSAAYLADDTPAAGAVPFGVYRVRFPVVNDTPTARTLNPLLEAKVGSGSFSAVAASAAEEPIVFLTSEWVEVSGGTTTAPDNPLLAADDVHFAVPEGFATLQGRRLTSANPGDPITLAPGTATEVEFTLSFGLDLPLGSTVQLRLTNVGAELAGAAIATIATSDTPPAAPAAGKRQGAEVDSAADAALAQRLFTPTRARLAADAPVLQAGSVNIPVTGNGGGHGTGLPGSDCATCHRTHTARKANLLPTEGSMSTTCFACHNGTGASSNIQGEYAMTRPANDAATASFYSHDATVATSNHTLASDDEFTGKLERHSECTDCHNPHRATNSVPSSQVLSGTASTGWSSSSALRGIRGLAVTNGAANTAPAYTALDGMIAPVTHEYQLCFTCHTGNTVLPANASGKRSRDTLDKGIEFNPANASMHPIEAAGKNQTAKMAASLAGPSTYKMWNFSTTDTVRCVNCHANSTTPNTAKAGDTLDSHASTNRGILLRPYRDRVLKGNQERYAAIDSALCLVCHGEAPFSVGGTTGNAMTGFRYHQKHMAGLAGKGSGGTDIDVSGAGQGNSLCAECHFRLHSTTFAIGGQTLSGSRLVSFSPNVIPATAGGQVIFTKNASGTGGTCTLTCHGKRHSNYTYSG